MQIPSQTSQYLGYKISEKGIEPSDEKIAVIKKITSLSSPKEVKAFLGLTGYFRRFVDGYAHAATPLNALLKKDTKFQWTDEGEKALTTLKEKLIKQPVLILPDFTKPFELHTDASGMALGSALMQREENNEPRPVAFGGRALLSNEKNYTVTELETHRS